jgi:hypothetical protein
MNRILKYAAGAALSVGALLGNVGTSGAQVYGEYGSYGYYNDYAYEPGPAYYGGYAFSPGYYGYNPWSRSRTLHHGQGPGCIQSPASIEYTSCD